MAEKPWKEAIEQVLRDSGGSMSRTEIADAIVSNGLRKRVGATPANTVVSYISTSLRDEGAKSPFVRVGGENTHFGNLWLKRPAVMPHNKLNLRKNLLRAVSKPALAGSFREVQDRDMIDWLGIELTDRMLDVGCGRGDYLGLLSNRLLFGTRDASVDESQRRRCGRCFLYWSTGG